MKVCVIYDKKGNCPVFAGVFPAGEVFVRELTIAVKNDSNLVYALYPEDYMLYILDFGTAYLDENLIEIEFTDFIGKKVSEDVERQD